MKNKINDKNISLLLSNEEKVFLTSKKIEINKLTTRWEWIYLYPYLTIDFYKAVLYNRYNRVPKREEIDQMGYRGFRQALKKFCNKTINDLTKEAGYIPYFEIKYDKLNFQEIINLFKNHIYPDLKKRYNLKENTPPIQDHLMYGGYRGVLDRLQKVNKTFNDLIIASGFELNKEFNYKGKNFDELVKLFNKEIYPNLRQKYSMDNNKTPKYDQIRRLYPGFITSLKRKGYSIINIFKQSNLEPNYEYLYNGKSYCELQNLFMKKILPDLQEKFEDDLIPLYENIEKEYRGFLAALKRFEKTYVDFILDLRFEPRIYFESLLGKILHEILKLFISKSLLNKTHRYNFYAEHKIFSDSNLCIDGYISINEDFLKEFNLNLNRFLKKSENNETHNILSNFIRDISQRIRYLLFDYSNGYFKRYNELNLELISRKILKYKSYPNSYLILIGTNWANSKLFKNLPSKIVYNSNIIFTKDVMLISPSLFANIIGLTDKEFNNLEKILTFNKNKDLNKLKKILEYFQKNK